MEKKSLQEIEKMSYSEFGKYFYGQVWNEWNNYIKAYKTQNPFNENSLPTGSENKKRRKALRDEYDKKAQEYANDKTDNMFHIVGEKLNEAYHKMPNSEKYKDELQFLNEAKNSAISESHKKQIQAAIDTIESGKNIFGESASDIIKYQLQKLWYMGAKQFVSNLIVKIGGKRYHKSEKDVSGSVYYDLPNTDRIRLSDHELPETEQRLYNRSIGVAGNWIEIVLDKPMPFSKLKEETLEHIEQNIGDEDLSKHYPEETDDLKKKIQAILNEKEFGGDAMSKQHQAIGTSKDLKIMTRINRHDMIAKCGKCNHKFSYRSNSDATIWECPECGNEALVK